MTDYFEPVPTASPFDDIGQYVAVLLGAVTDTLERPGFWEDDEAVEALGYMEDLKAYIQELPDMTPIPIGTILPFAGTDVPAKFLACNGTQYLKADYPALAMILHTSYSDDDEHFHVPDMRNRVPMGWNGQIIGDNTGTMGGEATHTLTVDEMPSHTHLQNPHTHNINGRTNATAFGDSNRLARAGMAGTDQSVASLAATPTNQNTGGGAAHNNLQPYLAVRYIIRAL